MRRKLTPRRGTSTLALIGFFALGIGCAAIPAIAVAQVSAGDAGVGYGPGWAPASDLEDSANAPSLTTAVDELAGNHGSQPWLGYGFVGGGVLALTFGLTAAARSPRRAPVRLDSGTGPVNGRRIPGTRAGP